MPRFSRTRQVNIAAACVQLINLVILLNNQISRVDADYGLGLWLGVVSGTMSVVFGIACIAIERSGTTILLCVVGLLIGVGSIADGLSRLGFL